MNLLNTTPIALATMYCRGCEYILDGLDRNRCPECGRTFDPDDLATFHLGEVPRPRFRYPILTATLFFALLLFIYRMAFYVPLPGGGLPVGLP